MRRFALLCLALPLFATEGDNLIGAGVKSRAVAGNGVAKNFGVESIFINPSLLTDNTNDEAALGITLFNPTVTAKNRTKHKSDFDFAAIPYIGYIHRVDDNQILGLGLFSVGGMGVDYTDTPPTSGLAGMQSDLAYAKLAMVYAKSLGKLSIGIGIDAAYGRLKLETATPPNHEGFRHDVGIGAHIGMHYRFNEYIGFAATYTTPVTLHYKSLYDFDGDGNADTLKLTQPQESAVGLNIHKDTWQLCLQYKKIWWAEADGYKDFGWSNQESFGVGIVYEDGSLTYLAGISYATAAIKSSHLRSFSQAFFNIVGFPAITRMHYAGGLSWRVTPKIRFNLSIVYAPKATLRYGPLEATNRQRSLALGIDYIF